MSQSILVTGMSGLIGSAVRARLEPRARLAALNRSDVPGVDTVRADLSDLDAIRPAFEGRDTVIHLAAKANKPLQLGRAARHQRHRHPQRARGGEARRLQARRLRQLRSDRRRLGAGRAVSRPRRGPDTTTCPADWLRIRHDMATRSNGLYGSTKIWGEALARHYADSSDLSAIALRIGFVNAEDRPINTRAFSVWCSQRDVVNAIERAVDLDESIGYDIFFVQSDNKWGYRDLSHGAEVLGFSPQDAAEDHRG